MSNLPQSRTQAPGQRQKCRLAFGIGAFASALAFSAMAQVTYQVTCALSASPVRAGATVPFRFLGDLPLQGENYTVSWGDGSVQTGNSFGDDYCYYYYYCNVPPYVHSVRLQHVYTTPATGVSITVQVESGESCTSNVFDVLPPPPAPPAPPPPLPLSPAYGPDAVLAIEYSHVDWGTYFLTASADEIAVLDGGAFGGVWWRTGEQFYVYPLTDPQNGAPISAVIVPRTGLPVSVATVWRFFSGKVFSPRSSHFYTGFAPEYNALVNGNVWQSEGPVFVVPMPEPDGTCRAGTTPIHRLYNAGMGGTPNHRFTTRNSSIMQMVEAGWKYEGIAFCSPS